MPEFIKSQPSDPKALLGRIKAVFPALSWESYVYIDEGWDHEVIILDNKLVFRFPNDDQYSLQNEIDVLKRLKPLVSVDIPDYGFVAPDFSFAGYPLIAGEPLAKELLTTLSSVERVSLMKQLAEFLSTLHNLKPDEYSDYVELSDIKQWQAEVRQQSAQQLRLTLDEDDFARVLEILSDTDELLERPLPAALLHGDVYYRHLLWDNSSKRLGIIDFSDMNIGDPAFDFAELYEYGDDFVREVYKFYTGPKDDTFLARAWTYQRWVSVFMMTDHFVYHKTSFDEARRTFDRIKSLAVIKNDERET